MCPKKEQSISGMLTSSLSSFISVDCAHRHAVPPSSLRLRCRSGARHAAWRRKRPAGDVIGPAPNKYALPCRSRASRSYCSYARASCRGCYKSAEAMGREEATPAPPPLRAALALLASHAMAQWGWRSWEFAVALLLSRLFPGALPPSRCSC